jgi:thiol-disulfide isomerase/thioredoxin
MAGAGGQATFSSEFDTARQVVANESKKHLLYTILSSRLNSSISTDAYKQRIDYFFSTYPKDTLTALLKFNYGIKSASLNNKSVFDELLLSSNGALIKWKDVLSKGAGKVVLIDFWARYCGPCVYEMPFSQNLEKEFRDKNIAFIYVSFDASKTSWEAGMKEVNLQNRQNSFLRVNPLGSGITGFYKTMYIPKYAIYDKKGRLVNIDAPRPSNPALKNILNKLINE